MLRRERIISHQFANLHGAAVDVAPSPPSGPKDLPYAKHLPGEPDQGQEEDGTHQDTALEIEE